MKRIILTLLCAPCVAFAHATLQKTVPQAGGTVSVAPAELRLDFSEAIEPRFTQVVVSAASGAPVAVGSLHVDPANARRLLVPVPKLVPGTYSVSWRAVSVDTHRTHGTYRFTVAP
jgi:methionine-rich copper-binding protein CopC